jgi:hypothetical protein
VIKLLVVSFFEEPAVTGDTLAMTENIALHHVPVRALFQLGGAPSHSSLFVLSVWSFLIIKGKR